MEVHCPELFGQDGLCDWLVTVGLAEAGLVRVGRVARDGGGGYRAVVGGVARVRQAELATNGAALQCYTALHCLIRQITLSYYNHV